eukprot:TRINITY_DN19416_c0_g1_i1.p1 TRINITY_DN19416_c0_g1~~TRINITY_DN19416_c0_g1_i1.p1  ORF type:complete len:207 (+),score=49.32 TRINITY_DN19416_c0_g1_i1:110-730(+)
MAVRRGLSLAAAVLALVPHASGLFFELKASTEECFKATPGMGHRLIGTYEADGSSEAIKVEVLRQPGTEPLYKSTDTSGKFEIEVQESGVHRLCFTSTSSDTQTVSFNFHVDSHSVGGADPSHKEFVTKEHTDKVSELVGDLEKKALDVLDQQQYSLTREAVHRDIAESTNARVMWWTCVEVVALILLATFQVCYLRSYFEVKQIV